MPDKQCSHCQEANEGIILDLLLGDAEQRLWSIDELAREIDHPIAACDAISGLHAAGLVHRLGEFVFATRAAIHHAEIDS